MLKSHEVQDAEPRLECRPSVWWARDEHAVGSAGLWARRRWVIHTSQSEHTYSNMLSCDVCVERNCDATLQLHVSCTIDRQGTAVGIPT